MNDRLKFRVWDKVSKRYFYLELKFGDNGYHPDFITDPVFEQCTGLKDKNGNLIYEGDLLTDGRDIGQVLWTGAGWGCTAFLFKKKPETLKICGNIHEQPDQKDVK